MLCSPNGPATSRMPHRRSGRHGLHLSALSLSVGSCATGHSTPTSLRSLLCQAMARGVTHFDITPDNACPRESAEKIALAIAPLLAHRSELVISARIGLGSFPDLMPGFGSRKRLLGGLDQLLLHTGLDYLDVLYAHRYDRATPLVETTQALASAVSRGKALYVGLSGYAPSMVRAANSRLQELGVPLTSCQTTYSLLDRWAEDGLLDILEKEGIGCIACAPLAHGVLADFPEEDQQPDATPALLPTLSRIAANRNQILVQLAISWVLRHPRITSALVTASDLSHLMEVCDSVTHLGFTQDEVAALNACCPAPSVHSLTFCDPAPAEDQDVLPATGRNGRHRKQPPDALCPETVTSPAQQE